MGVGGTVNDLSESQKQTWEQITKAISSKSHLELEQQLWTFRKMKQAVDREIASKINLAYNAGQLRILNATIKLIKSVLEPRK